MVPAGKGPAALIAFFGLTCIALSITIIVLIAEELYPGSGYYQVYYPATNSYSPVFYIDGACLMTNNSVNVCRYGYAVGAIGALSSIVLLVAMCAPPFITVLMSIFNSIWYLAFAITATVYNNNIEGDMSIPQNIRMYNEKYRRDVYALAWTCFAVSFVSLPLALAIKKKEAQHYEPEDKPMAGTAPYPAPGAGYPPASQPAGYPTV
ncbi:hypothetical protein ABPG75_005742 [Micractinium tetrahymenae]